MSEWSPELFYDIERSEKEGLLKPSVKQKEDFKLKKDKRTSDEKLWESHGTNMAR